VLNSLRIIATPEPQSLARTCKCYRVSTVYRDANSAGKAPITIVTVYWHVYPFNHHLSTCFCLFVYYSIIYTATLAYTDWRFEFRYVSSVDRNTNFGVTGIVCQHKGICAQDSTDPYPIGKFPDIQIGSMDF